MSRTKAFGDKAIKQLSNGFGGCAAKHFFGGAIEDEYPLLAINSDNGVHCRVNDSGQSCLAVAQLLFSAPLARSRRFLRFVSALRLSFPLFGKHLRIG